MIFCYHNGSFSKCKYNQIIFDLSYSYVYVENALLILRYSIFFYKVTDCKQKQLLKCHAEQKKSETVKTTTTNDF